MEEREKSVPKCYALCTRLNPIPQYYIAAFMGCLGLVNAYLMRQCLSPTITQLVLPRNYSAADVKSKAVCEADSDFYDVKTKTGHRDWSQSLQGFVLSSFYLGYLATHIPGGFLADKFGSKWVLSIGILSTAIFTLLTPLAIKYGDATGLIVLRILMGAGEGPTFPALSVLLADWVPMRKRGFLGSIVMGGGQVGSILANSISGWMLLHYDWMYVFYLWGIVAVLWFLFYIVLCSNSPLTHRCIRPEERQLLLEEIGDTSSKRRELPPPPLGKIMTSIPMWCLISAQIGHDWAFYIIIIYLPKYMNDVLQIRIERNGLLSALPNLVMWICSIISGIVADILIQRGLMTTTPVRKLMTGIASFGPAIFLIIASYTGCDRVLVITNFCICMGFMGAYYGGMKLTPIDMSPNYAGIVMSITNGVGALIGFVAPTSVGWLTPNTTMGEWRTVFWLAFAILFITGIIYCVWAKSEVQPWNDPEYNKKSSAKTS